MKKYIIPIVCATILIASCDQAEKEAVEDISIPKQEYIEIPTFKLYPTTNNWIFLKLDTSTGQIWLVQYSIDENKDRLETILNNKTLTPIGETIKPGRFELVPTKNMWNFILLDQVSGATYQVQWSFEKENRIIIPISQP